MIILKNLYIQNYRNIKEASITDFKSLNIFIGPNNCGKSSILKCINQLCDIVGSHGIMPFCENDFCSKMQRITQNQSGKANINGIKCKIEQDIQYLRKYKITLKYSFSDSIIIDILKKTYDTDDQGILNDIEQQIFASGKNEADNTNNVELNSHLAEVNENKSNDTYNPRFTFILKQFDDTGIEAVSPHVTLFCIPEIHEFIKSLVCFIEDNRLGTYKGKDLKDYINSKNLTGTQFGKLITFIKDVVDPKIKDYKQSSLELEKEDGFITTILEQGSGVRSLICLAVDILSTKEKSIVLIDEPELGLNPHSKQEFLKFLIEESKSKQIFITTHDPTFVNPTLWNKENIGVYLHSLIDESFLKVALDQNNNDPSTFGGYLPHTTSIKGNHIYVEGASDVYIIQIFLRKYLLNKHKDWAQKLNNVGIYHLNGNNWQHMLNTIPKHPYKCVILLDGDKKKDAKNICEKNRSSTNFNFEFSDSLTDLQNILDFAEKILHPTIIEKMYMYSHPVYCLMENGIESYLDSDLKSEITNYDKKIDGPTIAEKMDTIPEEFVKIFDLMKF